MKYTFVWLLIYFFYGCTSPNKNAIAIVNAPDIEKNIMSWLYYERDYMNWSADCIAFNEKDSLITKKEFLKQLVTGQYIPVRLKSKDSTIQYQLAIAHNAEVGNLIRNKAIVESHYDSMRGMSLPNFNFKTINGVIVGNNSTPRRTYAVNCWFIHCKSCVAEFSQLNELVDAYKNRPDIGFLGLAFDSADSIKAFLPNHTFKYTIIPNKEKYLMDTLQIIGFPTQLIVDSTGHIMNVYSNLNEMKAALKHL
ncbi:redoxin domain-containing protein [Hydrotalea sp.]|uniref:TlpA family protein disulfide reductase n=1 Tax=Hydrotalea sp. TaxID=2881279 RepID=UPI0025826689|nr:redoxin domain-containing protein [Hydrotalea sp.]